MASTLEENSNDGLITMEMTRYEKDLRRNLGLPESLPRSEVKLRAKEKRGTELAGSLHKRILSRRARELQKEGYEVTKEKILSHKNGLQWRVDIWAENEIEIIVVEIVVTSWPRKSLSALLKTLAKKHNKTITLLIEKYPVFPEKQIFTQ